MCLCKSVCFMYVFVLTSVDVIVFVFISLYLSPFLPIPFPTFIVCICVFLVFQRVIEDVYSGWFLWASLYFHFVNLVDEFKFLLVWQMCSYMNLFLLLKDEFLCPCVWMFFCVWLCMCIVLEYVNECVCVYLYASMCLFCVY